MYDQQYGGTRGGITDSWRTGEGGNGNYLIGRLVESRKWEWIFWPSTSKASGGKGEDGGSKDRPYYFGKRRIGEIAREEERQYNFKWQETRECGWERGHGEIVGASGWA